MAPLTEDQAEQLTARGIRVAPGAVASLVVTDDQLAGVKMADGAVVARRALVVLPLFVARSGLVASLGLQVTSHPLGIGEQVAADATGQTEIPGVWVAGNVTDLQANVVQSAASGSVAAAAINVDLVAEDTRLAVAAVREGRAAPSTPALA